jgi:hypothetical protein
MSNYNIRSKFSTILISVMASLPCAYVVCMEERDSKIQKEIAQKRGKWESQHIVRKKATAKVLSDDFKALGYSGEDTSFETSKEVARAAFGKGKILSLETISNIQRCDGADRKFGILGKVATRFGSLITKYPDLTDAEVNANLNFFIHTEIRDFKNRYPMGLSGDEEKDIRSIVSITGRECNQE